ncbi:hypothetical protein BJY01DRAFT_256877 [Aspergillus pseudoustus]|uniref:Oxidoreductase n=1 Tax=Aspergillus pseudoustus TaxID=1810923 RepID=A0ABR4JPW2_9EURO
MSFFQGKTFAVTGAGSGIGYAVAQRLASLCATELKACIGEQNVLSRVADICDRVAVERWISDTVKHFGHLDGAVNAAGAHPKESGKEPIWKVTDDDWEFAQRINVLGTLNLVRAQLGYMVDAVSDQKIKSGSIIVFGSNASVTGAANLSAYTTSKHAVLGLMRSAAMDAAPYNIRVNAICPGPIDTPMLRNVVPGPRRDAMASSIPLKRLGKAEEVAGFVAYLLSEDSAFCTGSVHMVDGGLTTC